MNSTTFFKHFKVKFHWMKEKKSFRNGQEDGQDEKIIIIIKDPWGKEGAAGIISRWDQCHQTNRKRDGAPAAESGIRNRVLHFTARLIPLKQSINRFQHRSSWLRNFQIGDTGFFFFYPAGMRKAECRPPPDWSSCSNRSRIFEDGIDRWNRRFESNSQIIDVVV